MLTKLVKRQLALFGVITVIALLFLGLYYLKVPTLMGIGQYRLTAELPASGGLYKTANVTYRGTTIGKVISVDPTETGVRATLSINKHYKIPKDASANVHSVSAVGEQYLDLVASGGINDYFHNGDTITKRTVPADLGKTLDAANRGLAALPADKLGVVLDESAQAIGGLGPALQRLVDSTQLIARNFLTDADSIRDIINNAGPIIDSQVTSGDAIGQWARNLNMLTSQAAGTDPELKRIIKQAAPTASQLNAVFSDVRESLPQTLANLVIVTDLTKRYYANMEQTLVMLPQATTLIETITAAFPDRAGLNIPGGFFNPPPPCFTGFLPASQYRAYNDTSPAELDHWYCRIPQDEPSNGVRGVRNIPCAYVPGKRAATPRDCRSDMPYIPLGTNPWYGDPNQIRNCPAPGARCDQPVDPGRVIQAPSTNTGMIPLPADRLPGTPPPVNDPVTRPGSGTVVCNGQQPNPCIYTPSGPAAVTYFPREEEVMVEGPEALGVTSYSVQNSMMLGDNGWKAMLAPSR